MPTSHGLAVTASAAGRAPIVDRVLSVAIDRTAPGARASVPRPPRIVRSEDRVPTVQSVPLDRRALSVRCWPLSPSG